jgi:uncharacterized protein YbaP (TraB family)
VLGNDSAVVLDAWFQLKAQESGKKVVGLETVTEQIAAVERIPLKYQARMLLQEVRDDGRSGANAALDAYLARDLDAVQAAVQESGMSGEVEKAMLQDRNVRMVERLEKHMRGHGIFVAVGAAHLPGEHGLIERLRRLGYTVLPVVGEQP